MTSYPQIIKLNVGGTIFQTTKYTLTKFENWFKAPLEQNLPLPTDESGVIFIDRSSKHFDKILNFMRDGHVDLPYTQQEIREILREALVFRLKALVDLCDEKLKYRFIENDWHLVQIMRNPEKPVFIIYYKMDTWDMVFGGDKAHQDAQTVLNLYKKQFDIYFKPNKETLNYWSYSIHDRDFNGCSQPQVFNIRNFQNEMKTKTECYTQEKELAQAVY